jgi:predicted dehydrogenase
VTRVRPERVGVGVVGLGYWGPNLARNFASLPDAELQWCCDAEEPARERIAWRFPRTRFTADLDDLLSDPALDAVVLATPVSTHASLAVRVLEAGKHCFVEKPLAQSVADADRAVDAARAAGRVLMVGHLLQYHPGVNKLKEIADSGELGDIHYIYGNRLNLGQLRAEENALWSLGAHDVSVLLHLADEEPYELNARGESYMREGIEDVVFAFMRFPSGVAAHLHLSWLDPHKERRFTVVGAKRMATFDDMDPERKVTVYDKGFDEKADTYGEYITRSGDIWSPRVPNDEPLRLECEHFVACVREGRAALSDGESGLRVVRVLEGLQQSLDETRRAGVARVGA